jgi:hypothetical protein
MWLFGSLWSRWRLAFKVVTPLLHIAFSAAQIHGSLVFWRMYRRQQRYIKEADDIDGEEAFEAKSCESLKPCEDTNISLEMEHVNSTTPMVR